MTLIGYLAGFLTLVAYMPQAIKTIKTKQTRDLSFGTYSMVAISALLWTVYGLGSHIPAISITNGVVFTLSTVVLFYKLKY